jgi:hypothetical protein
MGPGQSIVLGTLLRFLYFKQNTEQFENSSFNKGEKVGKRLKICNLKVILACVVADVTF